MRELLSYWPLLVFGIPWLLTAAFVVAGTVYTVLYDRRSPAERDADRFDMGLRMVSDIEAARIRRQERAARAACAPRSSHVTAAPQFRPVPTKHDQEA